MLDDFHHLDLEVGAGASPTVWTKITEGRTQGVDRALLFSGSDMDAEVVATIRRRGGETIVIGSPVDGAALTIELPTAEGPLERAIVGSVVAELLSLELWRRTTATEIAAD